MSKKTVTEKIVSLDAIDQHILDAMRKDGRAAFAQIAGKLKVSPGMIRQRYNRLVDMGLLKVVAISNPLQRGFKTMALVGIRTDGNKMLDVADAVSKLRKWSTWWLSAGDSILWRKSFAAIMRIC